LNAKNAELQKNAKRKIFMSLNMQNSPIPIFSFLQKSIVSAFFDRRPRAPKHAEARESCWLVVACSQPRYDPEEFLLLRMPPFARNIGP
jgi:hypothetical protein